MGHLQAVRQVVPSVRHLLPAQGERLLAKAIETRELAIAQLLLENGARVTMWSVKLALSGMPQPGALRMLLEGGPPEVANMLIASPGYGAYMWTCPVLHLLCSSARRYWGVSTGGRATPAPCMRAAGCARCF